MDTWQSWVTLVVATAVSYIARDIQQEKKNKKQEIESLEKDVGNKASIEALEDALKIVRHNSDRLTKLESQAVTEKDVREIHKEFFLPFMDTLTEIQKDTQQIKIQLAHLEARKAEKKPNEDSAV